MKRHLETGKTGEEMAARWLVQRGFEILHRNWRHSFYEIDIIAIKDGRLHFVEVKCRNKSSVGHPEDSVSRKKFKSLKRAADAFLQFFPEYHWIQYDILAITLDTNGEDEYFLLEDVFL